MADERERQNVYRRSLRKHSHKLIALGYRELRAENFIRSEEPEITRRLVRAMRKIMERDSSPPWVVLYSIQPESTLDVPGKRAKELPRVDIEVERHGRGVRPCFRFEAKRLGKNHTVGLYLGEDGLGCFTSGKYPLTHPHPEAGMLGYVQSQDEAAWAEKMKKALKRYPTRYSVANNGQWEQSSITSQLEYTYRSKHSCSAQEEDITVFHTLLRFCE